MEEYNKELKSVLMCFEPEDVSILGDLLQDLNEFNKFDNLSLGELIKNVKAIEEDNKNSEAAKLKAELDKKYLNQYIKYGEEGDDTILKRVKEITIDSAFGGSDYAIKFISDQVISYNDSSVDVKVRVGDDDYDFYRPIVLSSSIEEVEIISKEFYDEKLNLILNQKE